MDKIIISRRLLCSTREMFNFAAAIVSPVTDDDDESDISGSSLIYALSDSAELFSQSWHMSDIVHDVTLLWWVTDATRIRTEQAQM